MKKLNKIVLALVLGVCTLLFTTTVSALSLKSTDVVCDPESLDPGGQADCYIIGMPDGDDALHGFVVQTYTTKDLRLVGAKAKTDITNAAGAFTKSSSNSSAEGTAELSLASGTKTFRCPFDSDVASAQSDYGCAVFYSKTEKGVYTKADMIKNVKTSILPSTYTSSYGTFGSITVKLDESSTRNDCGEICVKVWNISNQSQYEHYQECNSGTPGDECGGAATALLEGKNYFCQELHMTSSTPLEPNADTGTFVSYAVLIAGALIAISAVAMAKKNNKFNKI